jgi:hypothetical protein
MGPDRIKEQSLHSPELCRKPARSNICEKKLLTPLRCPRIGSLLKLKSKE